MTKKERQKYLELNEIINNCPPNATILDNNVIAYSKINSPLYDRIICGISGGSDSDIVLDICCKCDKDKKIKYVWFDTGLEYEATKEHISALEQKYNIEIKTHKASIPIPMACKKYGQPFLSKNVSEMISRLQKHNFQWENESFEVLYKKYPHCKCALQWWTNTHKGAMFNISYNKYLKEFLIENPPKYKISNLCCKYGKKAVLEEVVKEYRAQMNISGIRRSEGGIRATTYKNCFTSSNSCDQYRPIFWYVNEDKSQYNNYYNISNSKCYTTYGLTRTGCAGCPYGKNFEFELDVIKTYEPKLYAAVCNIFGDSYAYTRLYREFCYKRNKK